MKRLWKKVKKDRLVSSHGTSSKSMRLLSWGDDEADGRNGNNQYSPGRQRQRQTKYEASYVNGKQRHLNSQAAAISYQYAMHEYEQTVEPHSSNDDGRNSSYSRSLSKSNQNQVTSNALHAGFPPVPSRSFAESSCGSAMDEDIYNFDAELGRNGLSTIEPHESSNHIAGILSNFIMYEESYGDSYIGETLRYVYPNGYQSMRPGSGPWKLSIAVFLFFVWLSVFIVGHCSDISEAEETEVDDVEGNQIEMRWCGSQLLYSAWFLSVVVTGMYLLKESTLFRVQQTDIE